MQCNRLTCCELSLCVCVCAYTSGLQKKRRRKFKREADTESESGQRKHDVTQSKKSSSPQTELRVGFPMTGGSPAEALQKNKIQSVAGTQAAVLLRQPYIKSRVLFLVF